MDEEEAEEEEDGVHISFIFAIGGRVGTFDGCCFCTTRLFGDETDRDKPPIERPSKFISGEADVVVVSAVVS